ncbi:MAG: M28 family peptidase, partial [Candidatus Hodarchaeota archaeon]
MGLEPELQKGTSIQPAAPQFFSSVENIVVRIEGISGKDDAVLLCAHLDSEPFESPGAIDDGASVVMILETARTIIQSGKLKNDIIILFSSPEESGMQGATLFVTEHRWAEDVKVAFNFEGGGYGRMLLQSVSANNGKLIKEFSKSVPNIFSFSFVNFLMGNTTTDFGQVFKPSGIPGLDFIPYTSKRTIHCKVDNINNVRLPDLQEYGQNILKLTRHFGNVELTDLCNKESQVFFSVLGLFTVHYSKSVSITFTVLISILGFFCIIFCMKRHVVRIYEMIAAFSAIFVSFALSIGMTLSLWSLISNSFTMHKFLFNGIEYHSEKFYTAFILILIIIVYFVFLLMNKIKKFNTTNMIAAIMVFSWVLAVSTGILFPEIGYIFTWITLFSSLSLIVGSRKNTKTEKQERSVLITYTINAVMSIILLLPVILIMVVIGPESYIRYIPAALLIILLFPVYFDLSKKSRLFSGLIIVCTSLLLLSIALFSDFDEICPRVNYVSFIQNADNDKSCWIINELYDSDLDDYSKQFIPENFKKVTIRSFIPDYPYDYTTYLVPFEYKSLPSPSVEIMTDTIIGNTRHLKLLIKSMRNAHSLNVYHPMNVKIEEVSVNGIKSEPLFGLKNENPNEEALLFYRNIPTEGIVLLLKLSPNIPFELRIRDKTQGVPLKENMNPMEENVIPYTDYGANST